MSRHRFPRTQGRRRWSTALAVAGICLFVAGGTAVAVKHPIASPSFNAVDVGPSEASAPSLDGSAASTGSATPATDPSASAASPQSVPNEATLPSASAPAGADSVPPSRSATAAATLAGLGTPGTPCRPARFALAALGIDTTVVTLARTAEGDLGTPSDSARGSAGWFPSVLAGADRGTVLMDGHTYHDDSAIFKTTFKQQVRTGMTMRLSCADGRAFSYRIAEVVLDLTPATYPRFVTERDLYSPVGPSQLVMVTCTDYIPAQRVWANRAVVIAVPAE